MVVPLVFVHMFLLVMRTSVLYSRELLAFVQMSLTIMRTSVLYIRELCNCHYFQSDIEKCMLLPGTTCQLYMKMLCYELHNIISISIIYSSDLLISPTPFYFELYFSTPGFLLGYQL